MKSLRAIVAAAALLYSGQAWAVCSTVSPAVPAQSSNLSSAPIRQNFAAAFTDINNILGMFVSATAPASPCTGQFWRDTSTNPNRIKQWDGVGWALWGLLDTSGHTFSAALSSGTVIATPPIAAAFASGTVTLSLGRNANFAVVANQLALATMPVGNLLANATAGVAEPVSSTPSAWLDRWCSSSSDTVPYRQAGGWTCTGMFLSNHVWGGTQTFASILANPINGLTWPSSGNQGGVLYFSGPTTISSSSFLFQDGFVFGGGSGGASLTSTIRPTTGQLPIGQTAGAPLLAVLNGDVVNNASGGTTIQANVVSFAKLQQLVAFTLMGNCSNATANAGAVTASAADQVLRVNTAGTACGFGAIDLSKTAAATGILQAASHPALTGDVTNSAGSVATTIAANVVSDTKLRQSAGLSVIGRSTNSTGNVADITAASDNQVLVRSGANIQFGSVNLQSIGVSGIMQPPNGGTGFSSYNQGDILYASSSTVLSALPKSAGVTNVLTNTGASNNPAWGQVPLASGVSGRLPYNNIQQAGAFSFIGNTTGSTADIGAFTIGSLTTKASPAAGDEILLADNAASGQIKRATVSSVASAGSVSSLNTFTGALSVLAGTGIGVTNSSPNITVSLSTARQTLPTQQRLTSGSGTYTTPANTLSIVITMVGAGGGGQGTGAGAGNGGNGTATCWNTSGAACTSPVYQAGPGSGGATTASTAGGTISGSGTCNQLALDGGDGAGAAANNQGYGGYGGNSFFGGNGQGGAGNNGGTAAKTNSGSGGGGAGLAGVGISGSGGGAGATCKVRINSPAGTYTYAIGTAGTAGAGTLTGATGGSGFILVEEYYNFLLRRDVLPEAANDNDIRPMWLADVA